ncbi:MAG: hypothetical protein NC200_05290, partial [Candidatus Gastranaerophilales bacterium]|nr:hypothetical protein [Candidatus Gastranaerophilales bacterium]
ISGDFQRFSQRLNEAFNQAMQDTSNAKNIMPNGQQNPEANTPTADTPAVETPAAGNSNKSGNDNLAMGLGIGSSVMNNLAGIFGGSSGGSGGSGSIGNDIAGGILKGLSSAMGSYA